MTEEAPSKSGNEGKDTASIIKEISNFLSIDDSYSQEEQLEKIFEYVILSKNLEGFKAGEGGDSENLKIRLEVKQKLLDLKEKLMAKRGDLSQTDIAAIRDNVDNILRDMDSREASLRAKETDILDRERKLGAMQKSIEEEKTKLLTLAQVQRDEYLKVLETETKEKENAVNRRKKLLDIKEQEIKERQKSILKQEIDILEEQLKSEFEERKVKTGVKKLDDLLTGGVPVPSNIMIYGPAFAGKEEMVYNIITSSIQRGLPSIILTFDRTSASILKNLSYFSPLVAGYLDLEMLHVIDTFTRTTNEEAESSGGITYLESQTDLEGVNKELNKISKELMKKSGSVVVAMFGFSSILNFLDRSQTLKFLQSFANERRDQNNIAFYLVEKGLRDESEIQAIAHFMDGIAEFKIEGSKSYIMVKGLTSVMSRDWIEVDFSKNNFNLKSFSLSKIK
ncbi:MAG: hypothetical protein M1515_00050 [Candidatus Thermoplasmatota archaeon]|jgi:KaiC/GvpD/RAD55 family RecA-like ATPase|nr:hypothetical protein [Candidatus Thermoplasmatota archaeon]